MAPAPTAMAETIAPAPPRARSAETPDAFLPTLMGPIGLFKVSTADVGPRNHLRLALHGQYFRASNFLVEGADGGPDTNTRLDGSFSFGFTPHESVEVFGAFLTSSNRNRRVSETGRRDPELIKSFGDLVLGGKGVWPIARGFTAGAELGLRFLSSITDLSFSPDSTSFWIGGVASLDLRPIANVPLRFHLNANFYLDNSSNLYDFTGTTIQTREVAMFAYGIQGSRLRFAFGLDAPLEQLTAPVPLQPFFELHSEIVTASADPAFAMYQNLTNRDQEWMTFGLRARVFRGLTLDAGVDVGLRSVGYQYGPPIAPWDITFGVAFPFDIDAFTRPVIVNKTVEKQAAAATTGNVAGTVKGGKDGKPVADAVVAFKDQTHARAATDPDGGFTSGPLPPGPIDVTVTAAGFESAKAMAVVVPGSTATLEVSLIAKQMTGNVRGKVLDAGGRGMAATLRFVGGAVFEAHSDAAGAYSAALPAGPYKVTIEAAGWPNKEVPLDIIAGQDRELDVTLRPANPDVTFTGQAFKLRVPIKFKAGAPKLDATVKGELEGVAAILAEHPEIRTLRIEAHWNGPAKQAKDLTDKQAALVKDYLVSKGAPADRVEALGKGGESPVVPNLSPANRAKNRRVELVVVQ
jgi:outer membrane protein OmpA-like peptidoglycan-associated protein